MTEETFEVAKKIKDQIDEAQQLLRDLYKADRCAFYNDTETGHCAEFYKGMEREDIGILNTLFDVLKWNAGVLLRVRLELLKKELEEI